MVRGKQEHKSKSTLNPLIDIDNDKADTIIGS